VDLAPRRDSSLEWWFVQGHISGEGFGRREFMLAMFRQGVAADGHMLLVSTFDPATGKHAVHSQVSPQLVANFLADAPAELARTRIDSHLIRAYLAEVESGGAPAPVHQTEAPAFIATEPLSVRWGDFSLFQRGECIDFQFTLPGDGRRVSLSARPAAAWLDDGEFEAGGALAEMAYQSCPRMALTGRLDGDPVVGRGWIDHQWGDYGWLRTGNTESHVLGWEWFAIDLPGNRELLVCHRHIMETGEVVSRFAVLFSPGAPPRLVGDVHLTEKRRWLSRRTVISYPLEWRIEIPSLRIDLDFAPAADDQEVPVFGIINGIWEGAGSVAGTVSGEPVSGRAWLELYGYGFVVDLAAYQKRWVDRIDATLKDFFPPELSERRLAAFAGAPRWRYDSAAMTEMIAVPAWDLLARGGKHWRPIYGLLLLDALGVDAAPYETAMSAITELVHTGSLIIDDIEDGSQTRRGQETIHVRHGLPTAINAGNMLYFLPLLTISNHPNLSPAQRDEIYRIIMEMLVQGHFGQAQDLFWSRPGAAREEGFWAGEHLGEHILQMHAFKSAAAVRAMSEIACIIAGSDKRQREACARFGESWGVAFQIVDDIHNFSDDPKWGKLRGEDIAAGKASYVIHRAVRLLPRPERDQLIALLDDPVARQTADGLAAGIRLVEQSGALAACRAEARVLVDADWPAFAETLPHSQAKIMLRIFVASLLDLPPAA
jgi:geranylgeranyl pyrophosphate synthase/predicted secreted hydrolase